MRSFEASRLICCVQRLPYRRTGGAAPWALGDTWRDEELAVPHAGRYRNVLTGASIDVRSSAPLTDVFRDLPVALLVREASEGKW
jgi:maltooligosyltrehalose synthase